MSAMAGLGIRLGLSPTQFGICKAPFLYTHRKLIWPSEEKIWFYPSSSDPTQHLVYWRKGKIFVVGQRLSSKPRREAQDLADDCYKIQSFSRSSPGTICPPHTTISARPLPTGAWDWSKWSPNQTWNEWVPDESPIRAWKRLPIKGGVP